MAKKKHINILISIDENYVERAIDMIRSINMQNDFFINVYLIYENLSEDAIEKISEFLSSNGIGVLKPYYFDSTKYKFPIYIEYISISTYFRLFAPFIIEENIDRILYLDCDLICTGEIYGLYNIDFDDNVIVACENLWRTEDKYIKKLVENDLGLPQNSIYINAGVLLINIPKYKEITSIDLIKKFIQQNFDKLYYQDQDVINKMFSGKIKLADIKYNYQINGVDYGKETFNNNIVHYSGGQKPWNDDCSEFTKAIPYYKFLKTKGDIDNLNRLMCLCSKNKIERIHKSTNNKIISKSKNNNDITIDIIIPVYNSYKTLDRTLSSIVTQIKTKKLNVYIIDDASKEDYDFVINYYNKLLNITYVKLEENRGPGYAREYGMSISNGEYIVFLDSDDIFSSPLSINILYNEISCNNCDVVRSVIYEELEDRFQTYINDNVGLHGKIYRRGFIKNNNIHFNDSRSNEDTGFNALIKLCGAQYMDINALTYIWCNNNESITRKDKKSYINRDLEYLAYNLYWALDSAIKKKCNYKNIEVGSLESLILLYNRTTSVDSTLISEKTIYYINKINDIFKRYNTMNVEDLVTKYMLANNFDIIKSDFYKFIGYKDKNIYENKNVSVNIQSERMKQGKLYCAHNIECVNDKKKHIELMNQYNKTSPYDIDVRKKLLTQMFARVGEGCIIEPPFYANWGGKNVYLGNCVYMNFNVSMVDDGNIYIGDNVLIGPNTTIATTNHPINPNLRKKYLYKKDIYIASNVWIGSGVIILPGVKIGENTVIGAGSIVVNDIPANVVAVGNPCRAIREINENDNIYFYKNEKIDWENLT